MKNSGSKFDVFLECVGLMMPGILMAGLLVSNAYFLRAAFVPIVAPQTSTAEAKMMADLAEIKRLLSELEANLDRRNRGIQNNENVADPARTEEP